MDYFQIGLIISCILVIVIPYIILKNRWLEDDMLEGLYDWWDGESIDSHHILGVFLVFLLIVAGFFITMLAWGFILPILIILVILNSMRNKRLKNKV